MAIAKWGAVLVAAVLVVAGCGSNDTKQEDPGTVNTALNACSNEKRAPVYAADIQFDGVDGTVIELRSIPAPPEVGDNDWTVEISDPAGAPVEGASLGFKQWMPDHAHAGVKDPSVTELGGGKYLLSPVNFNMPGFWVNTIQVKGDAASSNVDLKVCVLP